MSMNTKMIDTNLFLESLKKYLNIFIDLSRFRCDKKGNYLHIIYYNPVLNKKPSYINVHIKTFKNRISCKMNIKFDKDKKYIDNIIIKNKKIFLQTEITREYIKILNKIHQESRILNPILNLSFDLNIKDNNYKIYNLTYDIELWYYKKNNPDVRIYKNFIKEMNDYLDSYFLSKNIDSKEFDYKNKSELFFMLEI